MPMEKKPFLSAKGLLLCALLLLAAGIACAALSLSPRGTFALVEVDGQVVLERDLSSLAGTETVPLEGANGIQLTVELSPEGAGWPPPPAGPGVRPHRAAHPGGGVRHLPARPGHPPPGRGRGCHRRHLCTDWREDLPWKTQIWPRGLYRAFSCPGPGPLLFRGAAAPLPMMPPGAKLGLSNLATMYAADSLGLPSALFLAVFKGVFALLTRGGMAGLMSLSGGVISTVVMWLLLKRPTPLWGWWASAGPWPTTPPSCARPTSSPAPAYCFMCLPAGVRGAHRAADRSGAQADAEALGAAAKHPEVKLFSRTQKHLPRAARLRRCFFKLLFSFQSITSPGSRPIPPP